MKSSYNNYNASIVWIVTTNLQQINHSLTETYLRQIQSDKKYYTAAYFLYSMYEDNNNTSVCVTEYGIYLIMQARSRKISFAILE